MTDQDNIQDELGRLNSGLPVNNSQGPFSVPGGYFDGLAASVLAKLKGQQLSVADELRELSPLLASLSREMPYRLPAGYFDENLSALSFVEGDKRSAVLETIGKELPYTVPQGYFDTVPPLVLAKLPKNEAKRVPLFAGNWMRVAVAAVITGIIFLGGYQYFNSAGDAQTAGQPVDTSQNWLAKNEPRVVQDIKKASTNELDEFIRTVPVVPARQQAAAQPTEKATVKALLNDVTEKEIDAFLEQLPTAEDDLALID